MEFQKYLCIVFLFYFLLILLPTFSATSITCPSSSDDCHYTGNDTSVSYTCENNIMGDCHCGLAHECTCNNVNGDCFCDSSQKCYCNNANGDCNCGKSTTCHCKNTNGDCLCGQMWMLCLCGNTNGQCKMVQGAAALTAVGTILGFVLILACCTCCVMKFQKRRELKQQQRQRQASTPKNSREGKATPSNSAKKNLKLEPVLPKHHTRSEEDIHEAVNLETIPTSLPIPSPLTCNNTGCDCTFTRTEILGGEPLERHLDCPNCHHFTSEHSNIIKDRRNSSSKNRMEGEKPPAYLPSSS